MEYTNAHRQGPTFSELFTHLLPDTKGVPSRRPEGVSSREQYHARGYFRLYVVRRWRGHNLFAWKTGVYRSLNVRGNFAKQVRQFEQKEQSELDKRESDAGAESLRIRTPLENRGDRSQGRS